MGLVAVTSACQCQPRGSSCWSCSSLLQPSSWRSPRAGNLRFSRRKTKWVCCWGLCQQEAKSHGVPSLAEASRLKAWLAAAHCMSSWPLVLLLVNSPPAAGSPVPAAAHPALTLAAEPSPGPASLPFPG